MSPAAVVMRAMRPDEYEAYSAQRDADYVASMSGALPPEAAQEQARQGRAHFLPQGLATEGHHLLVAEAAGQVVGAAWVGLHEPRTGSTETAWLYDLRVVPAQRRAGYATAILGAVEEIARQAGAVRLGLNVFGTNLAAIALYESQGYVVTTQQMAKPLRQPRGR